MGKIQSDPEKPTKPEFKVAVSRLTVIGPELSNWNDEPILTVPPLIIVTLGRALVATVCADENRSSEDALTSLLVTMKLIGISPTVEVPAVAPLPPMAETEPVMAPVVSVARCVGTWNRLVAVTKIEPPVPTVALPPFPTIAP